MRGSVRAALAGVMLVCVLPPAVAAEEGWLTDPKSNCAVFGTGSGDSVAWTGACEDGFAAGLGTATFFRDGREVESFTADFTRGMVADGHVITRWGDGWSYRGEQKSGRFDGGGVLVNDKQDRFLGVWSEGKMNGFGLLDRADGSRYAGEWRDSLPNGEGELRRADGSIVAGRFSDGRMVETQAARANSAFRTAAMITVAAPTPSLPKPTGPFAALAGTRLKGADGSVVALSPIEGGIEMALTPAGGVPQKTTFTFMNDKMGTVVEDGSGHGANVTGFFRVTDNGVELHYADGRAETLTAGASGGVTMVTGGARMSCRSWYPEGHVFSEAEKKAALADYAVRLGLAVTESEAKSGCPAGMAAKTAAAPAPAMPSGMPMAAKPAATVKSAAITTAKPPVRNVKTAYAPAAPNALGAITPVAVRNSQVRAVDDALPPAAMAAGATPVTRPDGSDPSRCLKVESDGHNWGFRNQCDIALQFSYCLVADKGLAACGNGGAPGSVAGKGFGALIADKSLSAAGADHKFRWIACAGGAGEVIARLERSDPPSGRCERNAAITASN